MENKPQKNFANIWAIVLAAGKGTRMNATDAKNKVAYELNGKPIIRRTIENLQNAGIPNIVVVVGFAKDSVISLLDADVLIAEQDEQLGTGHAVKIGLEKVDEQAELILVINGDDSYLLKKEVIEKLMSHHVEASAVITFVTTKISDPTGLGRIIRDSNGRFVKIIEEKDATEEEKKITEINPACYLFDYSFLKNEIDNIQKSPVSGEYYINSLFDIAVEKGMSVEPVLIGGLHWRGINTQDELKAAEELVKSHE